MTGRLAAVGTLLAVAALACRANAPPPARGKAVAPPPANATFDYQIGAPYAPRPGVGVVSRDRSSAPAGGRHTI